MALNREHNCDLVRATATEDLSRYQFRLAEADGEESCALGSTTGTILGVIRVPAGNGSLNGLVRSGRTYVTSGCAITAGAQLVAYDAYGRVGPYSSGCGLQIIGHAIDAATAADELILAEIELQPPPEEPDALYRQLIAGEDLTGAQYCAVTLDGTGQAILCEDGEAVGMLTNAPDVGEVAIVQWSGVVSYEAGATNEQFDALIASTDGKLITAPQQGRAVFVIGVAEVGADEATTIPSGLRLVMAWRGGTEQQVYAASGDLHTYQYGAVKLDSNRQVAMAGAGELAIGILQNAPEDQGAAAIVQTAGLSSYRASAAISILAEVMATTNGALVTATGNAANIWVLGQVEVAAADAGVVTDGLRINPSWKWFPAT